MGDVGEVEPLRAGTGASAFSKREAAVDQLTRGRALWWSARRRVGAISVAPSRQCGQSGRHSRRCDQNTAGVGAPSASNDLNRVMALAP